MDIAVSANGVAIRLTDERWRHIVESRDELAGHHEDVLRSQSESLADRGDRAPAEGRVGRVRR